MLIYDVIVYGSAALGSLLSAWLVSCSVRDYRADTKQRSQPPEWRLTENEIRAKELRLSVGRDAHRRVRAGYQRGAR